MTDINTTDVWAPVPAFLKDGEPARPEASASGQVADDGRVRIGGQAPMFAAQDVADDGVVRIGGQAPMFTPDAIADMGVVRLGGQSPIF